MLRGAVRKEFVVCKKSTMSDTPVAVYHSSNDAMSHVKINDKIDMDNKRTSEEDINYLNRMSSHTVTIVKSTVETMYLVACSDPTKNIVTYNKRFAYEYIARQLAHEYKEYTDEQLKEDDEDTIIVRLMEYISDKITNDNIFHDFKSGNTYIISSVSVY